MGLKNRVATILNWFRDSSPKYEALPGEIHDDGEPISARNEPRHTIMRRVFQGFLLTGLSTAIILSIMTILSSGLFSAQSSCDSVDSGYQCQQDISQLWGQYSPFFSVPSEISGDVPPQCEIVMVNFLSRHGARYPSKTQSDLYNDLITRIHEQVKHYSEEYRFIKDYEYTLGSEDLTHFGQQQLINSGIKFYERYHSLAQRTIPFIRSAGSERVVKSAYKFSQGFHDRRAQDHSAEKDDSYPYNVLVIDEDDGTNNTLSHNLCDEFEFGYDSTIGRSATALWIPIFTPKIIARLNSNLQGMVFTGQDVIMLMHMCPFDTMASNTGEVSPFCSIFTKAEWQDYDYFQSLAKFYGYSQGNPLGPTQGVGFTNELIARLTSTPVHDHTSTNSTLDSSQDTFPLGKNMTMYADFSHDNDMAGIFSALGLFSSTQPLSNTTRESITETNGYSSSWTIPFAARAYFEKLVCGEGREEFVRIIVNDRVIPLQNCNANAQGMCSINQFVESLDFARRGGNWDLCFK